MSLQCGTCHTSSFPPGPPSISAHKVEERGGVNITASAHSVLYAMDRLSALAYKCTMTDLDPPYLNAELLPGSLERWINHLSDLVLQRKRERHAMKSSSQAAGNVFAHLANRAKGLPKGLVPKRPATNFSRLHKNGERKDNRDTPNLFRLVRNLIGHFQPRPERLLQEFTRMDEYCLPPLFLGMRVHVHCYLQKA